MSVIRLPRKVPILASRREHRKIESVRFFKSRISGHTSGFDELLYTDADVEPTADDVTVKQPVKKANSSSLQSKQLPDPYDYIVSTFIPVAGLTPIMPSYSFYKLVNLVRASNILPQCIECYVTNIESYGYVLEYIGEEGKENLPRVQEEKKKLEAFIALSSPEDSHLEVKKKSRADYETLGNRYFEVARNLSGEIVMFDHVPGVTMYRTRREMEPIEVVIEIPNPSDPSQMVRKKALRYFCRFIQMTYTTTGWRRVFFKEFGDPRSISPVTGDVDDTLAVENQATEILMLSNYTPGYIYGLPRWIGQLPSILGSREAEMVNLRFFRENAIPAMAVLVSGGALTRESFESIEDMINAVKGAGAMHRVLVLEATSDDSSGGVEQTIPAPRIDMKPMSDRRQQDALFKDYGQDNRQKIRSSFRIPPILVGLVDDYTRASAVSSMITAEQQVFVPERVAFDDVMNNKILKTYKPKYWRYKSIGPPVVDPDALTKIVEQLDDAGALTPNAVIKIANKVLDVEIKPVAEDWGDYPFPVLMQYVNQGREIKGLTEFLIDLDKEAKQEKARLKATQPPAAPASPGATGKPAIPGKYGNSKDKNSRSFKHELQKAVRSELSTIVEELQSRIIENLQDRAISGETLLEDDDA